MQPLFYVIAIMGCPDGSQACAQQRVEPVRYESVAACQAAMPAALERNSDISYPVIQATCQASGMRMAREQHPNQARG